MDKHLVSRRRFIGTSVAALAAQTLPGCGSSNPVNTAGTATSTTTTSPDTTTSPSTPATPVVTPPAAETISINSRAPGSLPNAAAVAGTANTALPFEHIIVVMMENHSFDNYLGMLPVRGQPLADGFHFDSAGNPLNYNPATGGYQRVFHLKGTCQPNGVTQTWTATRNQIDGGKMDGFARTDGEAMGYWDESDLPFYYSLARTFCVGNRSFCSATAQTYPNRRYLYAGTSEGLITTDSKTFTLPAPANGTLMDLLSQYNVSWKNYFSDLPATVIIPQNLEKHPGNYATMAQFFLDCAAGTLPSVSFVDPEFGAIDDVGGTLFSYLNKVPGLPAPLQGALTALGNVINAQGGDEENPQDIAIGEAFVASVVNAVMKSPNWAKTLLVWTYDEHGGYYDHVPPANAVPPDSILPMLATTDVPGTFDITGVRIPTVVVSPWSRPNAVSNVPHDHTAIIATIAAKWNLPALTWRDAQSTTLLDYLDLKSAPAFLTPPTLANPALPALLQGTCSGTPQTPVITTTP